MELVHLTCYQGLLHFMMSIIFSCITLIATSLIIIWASEKVSSNPLHLHSQSSGVVRLRGIKISEPIWWISLYQVGQPRGQFFISDGAIWPWPMGYIVAIVDGWAIMHSNNKNQQTINLRPRSRLGIHRDVEFPQSQARASEVIPTQVLQGTR